MPPIRLFALSLLTVAVSGCGEKQTEGPERKTAAGEVLGGSISDAMLPLDTVQSQSPPLRESAADSGDGSESRDDKGEAAPPPASSPTSEPAAEASASASPPAAED